VPSAIVGAKRSVALTAQEMLLVVEQLVPEHLQGHVAGKLEWLTTATTFVYSKARA
jgi:hypothetical protein